MSTVRRISTIVVIVAILGSSGCMFGRRGWGGDHYREGDPGGQQR
jgi:hypothetical protein